MTQEQNIQQFKPPHFTNIDDIHAWLGYQQIKVYEIDEEMRVTVHQNVRIEIGPNSALPVTFKEVRGDFILDGDSNSCLEEKKEESPFKTLVGAPAIVTGSFRCHKTSITNLVGGPSVVGEDYDCSNNLLTSLEGAPETIEGSFNVSSNNLQSLEHCPKKIDALFSFVNNKIENFKHCPKFIGTDVHAYINSLNSVDDLIDCEIGGSLFMSKNPDLPVHEIELLKWAKINGKELRQELISRHEKKMLESQINQNGAVRGVNHSNRSNEIKI